MRTLVTAALAVALLVGIGLARRPADRQLLVPLLDEALAPDGRLRWDCEPATVTPVELGRLDFAKGLAGWAAIDEAGRLWRDAPGRPVEGFPRVHDPESEEAPKFARFPTARGALCTQFSLPSRRWIRVTAMARRAPSATTATSGRADRQARLFVLPLRRRLDLTQELGKRTYFELALDARLRSSHEPTFGGPTTPPNDRFEMTSLDFLTPPDTQALLLTYSAGDGTAGSAVDLAWLRIEELPLRHALALGVETQPPSDLRQSLPPDPLDVGFSKPIRDVSPGLRKVEDAEERRNALVLPAPATASFEAQLPVGELVLEFGLTRIHEARRDWGRSPLEVELVVEPTDEHASKERLTETFPLPADRGAGWRDRTLDLSALAGGRARFTWRVSTKLPTLDLVAVGAPIIRRRAPRDPRPNIVLVSLDTLRNDHLGCNGYPRPTTPVLDALARDAAWFRDASSTSSYTLPAHGSMVTGQLPTRHGAISESPGRDRLSLDRSDLLAARLREAGWRTAAFTGGAYLRASFGFDQGFDQYDVTDLALPADAPRARSLPRAGDAAFNARHRESRRFDHALDWIRAHADGPFFLFLHTYLVHEYLADPATEARFCGSTASKVARGDLDPIRDRTRPPPHPADLDRFVDAYDATLRDADRYVGALLATLRELGELDSTIVIVTSDHGEEFHDHGGVNHGRTLHEEMVRVPLFVRVPGIAPREIDTPVSLLDLTPTLFELCGLAPRHPMDGRSLLPLLRGEDMEPRAIEAELELVCENRWWMRREGELKGLDIRDDRTEKALETAGQVRRAPRRMAYAVGRDAAESLDLRSDLRDPPDLPLPDLFERLDEQRAEARQRRSEAATGAAPPDGLRGHDRADVVGLGYVDASDGGCEGD